MSNLNGCDAISERIRSAVLLHWLSRLPENWTAVLKREGKGLERALNSESIQQPHVVVTSDAVVVSCLITDGNNNRIPYSVTLSKSDVVDSLLSTSLTTKGVTRFQGVKGATA